VQSLLQLAREIEAGRGPGTDRLRTGYLPGDGVIELRKRLRTRGMRDREHADSVVGRGSDLIERVLGPLHRHFHVRLARAEEYIAHQNVAYRLLHAGIALRLDSIIGQIDHMPLLSDEKPTLPATEPKVSRRASQKNIDAAAKAQTGRGKPNNEWLLALDEKWQSWSNEMWTEIRQLVRVRSVDTPDALLLSPTQAYYARENLKLRLLNARLALLSRNESAFRSDMIAAQDAITKYFDTRAKQTQTAQALLKQVQGSNLAIEMPTLADSLNAVRNYKAKP